MFARDVLPECSTNLVALCLLSVSWLFRIVLFSLDTYTLAGLKMDLRVECQHNVSAWMYTLDAGQARCFSGVYCCVVRTYNLTHDACWLEIEVCRGLVDYEVDRVRCRGRVVSCKSDESSVIGDAVCIVKSMFGQVGGAQARARASQRVPSPGALHRAIGWSVRSHSINATIHYRHSRDSTKVASPRSRTIWSRSGHL